MKTTEKTIQKIINNFPRNVGKLAGNLVGYQKVGLGGDENVKTQLRRKQD